MKKIDGWVTTPQGFLAAGVKAGIKASGNHDVAVIYSTVTAATGAAFTQNKMCAAPVLVSRKVAAKSYAQAIVVNCQKALPTLLTLWTKPAARAALWRFRQRILLSSMRLMSLN